MGRDLVPRNISSYETKLHLPSIGVVWSYRSGGAEEAVPSLWVLDACRRVGGGVQGCTWHKELTIVQMQSTNQQIKSVDSCDTIRCSPTESQEEQRQEARKEPLPHCQYQELVGLRPILPLLQSLRNLCIKTSAFTLRRTQATLAGSPARPPLPPPPSRRGHTRLPATGAGEVPSSPTVPTYPTRPQESLFIKLTRIHSSSRENIWRQKEGRREVIACH